MGTAHLGRRQTGTGGNRRRQKNQALPGILRPLSLTGQMGVEQGRRDTSLCFPQCRRQALTTGAGKEKNPSDTAKPRGKCLYRMHFVSTPAMPAAVISWGLRGGSDQTPTSKKKKHFSLYSLYKTGKRHGCRHFLSTTVPSLAISGAWLAYKST